MHSGAHLITEALMHAGVNLPLFWGWLDDTQEVGAGSVGFLLTLQHAL